MSWGLFFLFMFSNDYLFLIKATWHVQEAPVVFHRNSYYVIGGRDARKTMSIIGRFHIPTITWSKAGMLKVARRGHGAILNGDTLIVAGGAGTKKTETCNLSDNGTVNACTEQTAPTLTNYYYYPELFLVNESFCET